MKTLVFVGGKDVGLHCLQSIIDAQDSLNYRVIAIVPNASNILSGSEIAELGQTHNIQVYSSLGDIQESKFDFLVSVQYDKILPKDQIDRCTELAVNLHMAPVPEYRGCNQFTFAITENAKEFGTTIHRLEPGIDSGAILFEKRFPIENEAFVKELHDRTVQESKKLFDFALPKLIKAEYSEKAQGEFTDRKVGFHLRSAINSIKKIDVNWPKEKQLRYFRASYFPPFSPPVLVKDGVVLQELDMNWYKKLKQ